MLFKMKVDLIFLLISTSIKTSERVQYLFANIVKCAILYEHYYQYRMRST
jgi:hypothetical protein